MEDVAFLIKGVIKNVFIDFGKPLNTTFSGL